MSETSERQGWHWWHWLYLAVAAYLLPLLFLLLDHASEINLSAKLGPEVNAMIDVIYWPIFRLPGI